MINTQKKGRPFRIRGWIATLGGFLVVQLIFVVCDIFSWSPYQEFNAGTLLGRVSNSKLFTEWFAPYTTPQFNVFTAFFAITLLPSALIGAIKDLFSRI